MRIEILGWISESLRCPDMDVNLINGSDIAKVSLIQMPNGTAKTTTLNLFRAVLNGEAKFWSPEKISSFRRPGENNPEGKFILKLRIDGRPLTFELILNFDEGKAEYWTTSPGSGGIILGWQPPGNVRRFFDNRFVQLFIFDGELAQDLLDRSKSEASQAIDTLFQLYLIKEIHQKSEEYWEAASKNKANKMKGLTQRRNRVKELEKRIETVQIKKEKSLVEREKIELEIEELKSIIEQHIKADQNLREQFEEKQKHEATTSQQVKTSLNQVMNQIRKPHLLHNIFAESLVELKSQLDRLTLPASTSRQFFIELLEEEECICGQPLNHAMRQEIEKRSESFLSQDTSGVINAIKSDIILHLIENNSVENLTNSLENLQKDIIARDLAQTELNALTQQLIDQGDKELEKWKKLLNEKTHRKQELDASIKEIERSSNPTDFKNSIQDIFCLQSLESLKIDEKAKLSEITETIQLRKQTDILQKILNKSLEKAKNNLTSSLISDCNEKLKNVLSRDPVQIQEISRSLELLNQDGASAGQTLSVGYVFLTTLLHRSQHQFPLVVDSPANPLGIKERRNIANLIPELCSQFIAFTTTSEREGFTDTLYKATNGNTKFMTAFRITPGTDYLLQSLPHKEAKKTKNCVFVEGKEYFDAFDKETDEE